MNDVRLTRRSFGASLFTSVTACGVAARASATEDTPNSGPAPTSLRSDIDVDGLKVFGHGRVLWLHLDDAVLERKTIALPRLCAPMRSFGWKDHSDIELKFAPEPREWIFSWKSTPKNVNVIEIVFDEDPVLLNDLPPVRATADGSVMLHAFQAITHGEKLRFEPQPFKNTVGYWTVPTDYATWKLVVEQPGRFAVAVLQGCGAGQGGSEGVVTLRTKEDVKASLPFETLDTSHFQNFRWRHLGDVLLDDAGEYELRIEPKRVAKNAFCDVRAVHLVRQAT